jgi:hypothetical protein
MAIPCAEFAIPIYSPWVIASTAARPSSEIAKKGGTVHTSLVVQVTCGTHCVSGAQVGFSGARRRLIAFQAVAGLSPALITSLLPKANHPAHRVSRRLSRPRSIQPHRLPKAPPTYPSRRRTINRYPPQTLVGISAQLPAKAWVAPAFQVSSQCAAAFSLSTRISPDDFIFCSSHV